MATPKKPRGTVAISADKGWLRLRWLQEGVRQTLYLGLVDTPANRKKARQAAAQLEANLAAGLNPHRSSGNSQKPSTIVGLFEEFCTKREDVDARTLEKYRAVTTRLTGFFGDKKLPCSVEDAKNFLDYLKQFQSPRTAKDRLVILRACWDWGKGRRMVSENPWRQVKVRCPPLRPRRPFSAEELRRILAVFETCYPDYAVYVNFLVLTGFRLAEAAGLRWRAVSEGYQSIWVGETITRGGRSKATKTNKDRVFPCNDRLKELLAAIYRPDAQPDDLVFPAPSGGPIDDNRFRKQVWKPALEKARIVYRPAYNLRHTFISHCLQQGMAPVELATITGHDVATLYRNYAGCVASRPQVPDFL
jgi:integrase